MRTIILILLSLICCYQSINGFGYTYPKGAINKLVNDTLKIICTINMTLSEEMNSSYLSYRDITRTRPNASVKILNETSIELTVENIQATDDEKFVCFFNNTDSVSYNQVFVGYKPEKVNNFKCRSHNWMNLNCSFERPYNPVVPNLTLQYDLLPDTKTPMFDCPLEDSDQVYWCFMDYNSKLYRQSYEFYNFTLVSSNLFGHLTEYFSINNYKSVIPAAPVNLEILDLTSNSAYLKWDIPFKLTTFPRNLIHEVKYMSIIDMKWILLPLINDSNSTHFKQLENLDYAYVWYDLRIRIKVDGAPDLEEMWSEYAKITFRTDSRIPDNPPETDIGGFHINDNQHLFIYWKELDAAKYNDKDLHYKILVNNQLIKPNESTSTMAKYERLTTLHNIQYDFEFSIYSVNNIGSSVNASRIFVPRKSQRVDPPQHLKKILDQNSSSDYHHTYNISWDAPSKNKSIDSYTVFWCRSKNDSPNQCGNSINFKHVKQNNFSYSTNDTLNFAVSANTLNSSSGMVWALCTALPNNDIGKLSTIWINKIQPTSIEFQWSLNCIDRTILTGYILTYCPISDPQNLVCELEKKAYITSNVTRFTLTGLSPYTTYKTVISMTSTKQTGPPCDPLVNTTLEAAPTPPRDLKYSDVTNTSVTLKWTSPEHLNGVLMKYQIWYNDKFKYIEKHDALSLEYVLNNLPSYTEFDILLMACTVACSGPSNSIRIKTKIGTPGELKQPTLSDENGIKIKWEPPNVYGGPIQYYELTTRITSEDGNVIQRTVEINGTTCTMQIQPCLTGSDNYEFSVQAVNVIQTADVNDLEYDLHKNKTEKVINVTTTAKNEMPSKICEEQDGIQLKNYIQSVKYASKLRSNPSTSLYYLCRHTMSELYMIVISLFGIAALSYVSYVVIKKIKKMKDIGIELPAGLEDIKKESKGKHLHLEYTINKNGITRSDEVLCPALEGGEQEESLLRNRKESGSSNSTENNSSGEYNEDIYRHQNDNDNTNSISDNLVTSSPTPLLPTLSPPKLAHTKSLLTSSVLIDKILPINLSSAQLPVQPMPPISSSNYVPASMFTQTISPIPVQPLQVTQPLLPTTSNGYVSHEAVMGKPIPSGYVPWSTVEAKPPHTNTNDDPKSKTTIVTSTDVQGISGYVTHKQLSDFGQLMQ